MRSILKFLSFFVISMQNIEVLSVCFTRKWLGEAKTLCSPKDTKNFRLDNLDEEINILEKKLSEGYQEIGFCHNDLQYGNIMMDEETRLITIIVSYGYIFFSFHSILFKFVAYGAQNMLSLYRVRS